MIVPVGHLAPQCLKLGPVRRYITRETPGPENQSAGTVQINIDAGGVEGGGIIEAGAALVGELSTHVILGGLGLGLRGGAGASIRAVAFVAAGSTAAVPLERKVSVEVSASIVACGAAVILVGVLTPREPGFSLFAAVGVGVEHQVDLVMVQNPGRVGVGAIVVHQVFGETGCQFGGGVFTGVDRTGHEQLGLGAGDGRVGQTQDHHVIAPQAG